MIVRIHFMRHGETVGNASGIVCGHMETPLNKNGIEQATSASKIWCKDYWKSYTSDLSRAQSTAELVLKIKPVNHNFGSTSLIIDKRLREVAKGVREGRSMHLSYDEAMMEYMNEQKQRNDGLMKAPTALLETDDEVWKRVQSWIKDVAFDAINEDNVNLPTIENDEVVKTVFAASHSGTIRIAIQNLVADQLSKYKLKENIINNLNVEHGNSEVKMLIPNTSVTVIDIKPKASFASIYKNEKNNGETTFENELLWDAKLVKLTCDKHLKNAT